MRLKGNTAPAGQPDNRARITGIRPEMAVGLQIIESVFKRRGFELIVTACTDSRHRAGSLHYVGLAVDLGFGTVGPEQRTPLILELREMLGPDFDVVLEADHLHAEFQPKQPLNL